MCESQVSARMVCYSWQDFISRVTGEVIPTKIYLLETSLLWDDLSKKVYVAKYFLVRLWVYEPRFILTEIEVLDWVNSGSKEAFKNELTNVLSLIPIITELLHIKNFDRRVIVEDLPE